MNKRHTEKKQLNPLRYICCPLCKGDLRLRGALLLCSHCAKTFKKKDGIYLLLPDQSRELALTIEKWDRIYQLQLKNKTYQREQKSYLDLYAEDTKRQLREVKAFTRSVYLEIGCGPFFLGQEIADQTKVIIGIDICPGALQIAKTMLEKRGITNAILIQGDILALPLKGESIDLIYGGGVIEHFPDTQQCVNELHRVLRSGGVSFNTVPYLNLGSLTYRQVWGNIPNFPVLRQFAEFVHIKLLGAKHMIFGFEMSFTKGTLRRIHERAGFRKITISRFDVALVFEFVPAILRRPLQYLARNSALFWPMVKIIATK